VAIDTITLTLDRAVALVLFDFLARTTDEMDGEPLRDGLDDPAELPALWSLLAELEESLTEPFAADYAKRLAQARSDVRKRYGSATVREP
jgi:hypothetical protein